MPDSKSPEPVRAEEVALLYLYVETPLHAGAEPHEESTADLPIQREEATQYPIIWASSLKGALRARAEATRPADQVACVFGPSPEGADEEKFTGALTLADSRLLLFPVRTLAEVFAWVTCPSVIARFRRDAQVHLSAPPACPPLPDLPPKTVWVAPDGRLRSRKGRVTLEEISFQATEQPEVAALAGWLADRVLPTGESFAYWRQKLACDLVILPDRAFRFFTLNATEIISRIRIDRETGTAAPGALWTEEYLPVESVLYAPIGARAPLHPAGDLTLAGAVIDWCRALAPERLQLGAGYTLGRGLLRLRWSGGDGSNPGGETA
jgi:CRISPR-associated protein Cmr4